MDNRLDLQDIKVLDVATESIPDLEDNDNSLNKGGTLYFCSINDSEKI